MFYKWGTHEVCIDFGERRNAGSNQYMEKKRCSNRLLFIILGRKRYELRSSV